MAYVKVEDFLRDLELEPIYLGENDKIDIETSDLNRPGLQFANFFDFFAHGTSSRLQIIGQTEMTYLKTLDANVCQERLNEFFDFDITCVIICRNMDAIPEMVDAAKRHNCPIFRSSMVTTSFMSKAIEYLNSLLAPSKTEHGELVDVYGVGIMIMGESGIGKSETALELIERGHRLATDDVVEIKKVAENRLIGEAPESTRHFMEIRGIGIIDIRAMYGIGAVIKNKTIDMVISLEHWRENFMYDRIGTNDDYIEILGVEIPRLVIPVRPGRDLAIITEVAARNFRLKNMGYNAPLELDRRINGKIHD